MCGIIGFTNFFSSTESQGILRKMGALQYHRGPDEWGEYISENVALGHNRLSILDLELGKQPMISYDNRYQIVFNGEIYNYKELREELIKEGVVFNTNSDTEVLINGFAIYKEEFVKRLSGMFSFCIYDTIDQKLFLCRDSIGIKPLYYSIVNGQLVFASEVKPIVLFRKILSTEISINIQAVKRYFHFRSGTYNETMINEINSLTPGSILTFNILGGELEQKQYYYPVLDRSFQSDKLSEIESLLSASVKAHMISDVPLGVFLSGGIDSSLITHYASKISSVTNFTISTDSEYDESKYAMIASKATSSELDIKKITGQNFLEEYEYWGFVNDDPVSDPSALALMILSRHVNKKGYKVMLAGEGADELFGGYNSYLKFVLNRRFSKLPILGKTLNKILSNRFQKLKDYGGKTAYLGTAHLTSFAEKRQLFHQDVSINSAEFEINYSDLKTKDNLRLACLADQNYRLPSDILARTDRATMAYSIEARVPFLSPEIINFSNSLSEDQCLKIRNSRGKVLLKELCLKYFKKDFVYRKKVGFELPVGDWLSVDFKDIIHKNIQKQKFDFINYSYIRKVYENDSNPGLIWAWLQLENWYDKIFELNASTKHPRIQNDEDLILYFENTKLIN